MHAFVVATPLSEVWSQLTAELLPVLSAYRAQLADLDVAVKADDTLLSEADVAIQKRIVSLISAYEPKARFIAEEGGVRLDQGSTASGRVWVIDPIDGTAEFVKPEGSEFCTVVAALSDGRPDACWVLAPELGEGRSSVVITLDGAGMLPKVNGEYACTAQIGGPPLAASATRSATRPARAFEAVAEQRGTPEDPNDIADPGHGPDVSGPAWSDWALLVCLVLLRAPEAVGRRRRARSGLRYRTQRGRL